MQRVQCSLAPGCVGGRAVSLFCRFCCFVNLSIMPGKGGRLMSCRGFCASFHRFSMLPASECVYGCVSLCLSLPLSVPLFHSLSLSVSLCLSLSLCSPEVNRYSLFPSHLNPTPTPSRALTHAHTFARSLLIRAVPENRLVQLENAFSYYRLCSLTIRAVLERRLVQL